MPVDEFPLTAPRPPISPASSLSLSPGNVFEMKNQSPLGRKTFKVFLLLSDSIQSYPLAFSLQGLVPSQPALAQDQGLGSKLPLHRLTSTEHPPPWPTPLQLCPHPSLTLTSDFRACRTPHFLSCSCPVESTLLPLLHANPWRPLQPPSKAALLWKVTHP